MSLKDYKITQNDIETKGVVAAPDVMSGDPQANKRIFDRLIREAVAEKVNSLVDALVSSGVEVILKRGDDSIQYIRLNDDNVLEVSTDGKEYFSTVGSGHIIVDKYGKDVPKGLRLQFDNFEVREEDGTIIVHGVAEEIAGAIPSTDKGAPNGVAGLDGTRKVIQPQQWQSNPNLLHNWYFGNPVNQRGRTEYSGGGYTIDRWRLYGDDDVLYVRDNFIETTGITQVIEHGEVYLGIPITLSILYEESDGAIDMIDDTYVISAAGENFIYAPSSSDRAKPAYSLGSNTKGEIRLSIYKTTNGDSLKVHSVKLEIGAHQTHAHQDADGNWVLNEIPNKGEELIRCQSASVDYDGSGGVAVVETGTWTPVFADGSVFTAKNSTYSKVGSFVSVASNIYMNGSEASEVVFSGLPFLPKRATVGHFFTFITNATTNIANHIFVNTDGQCRCVKTGVSYANRNVAVSEIGAENYIGIYIMYETNE